MRHYRRFRRSRPKCRVDSTRPLRHAVSVAERDLKRLGAAIVSVRDLLGVTQEEFAERAGLSLKTVQRVELAIGKPRATTFKGLDRGAGWVSGGARGIYEDGREPVDEQPHAGSDEPAAWPTDDEILAMDARAIAERYVKTDRDHGKIAADDWLFHALTVRRNARRTLAVDGS